LLRYFVVACLALTFCAASSACQQTGQPQAQSTPTQSTTQKPSDTSSTLPSAPAPQQNTPPKPPPQPKRILGIMPNYRAVSAGVKAPPPTPRVLFKVATENSFDYSAFVFVGVTSLLAEGDNAHSQLGKGVGGYWAYYWRGYLDKTDGNYMVDFAFPTLLHEDERYYAKGTGSIWNRGVYAATRVVITPHDSGQNGFNGAEILGRGVSQAISLTYYPSATQTLGGYSTKFAYAIGRDALTNVFREFWPDISTHLLHRRS
jgi:hypothetical protein